MSQPTSKPSTSRIASHVEAVPTAQQWACYAAATDALAWQVSLYQFAHARAVESVRGQWHRSFQPSAN